MIIVLLIIISMTSGHAMEPTGHPTSPFSIVSTTSTTTTTTTVAPSPTYIGAHYPYSQGSYVSDPFKPNHPFPYPQTNPQVPQVPKIVPYQQTQPTYQWQTQPTYPSQIQPTYQSQTQPTYQSQTQPTYQWQTQPTYQWQTQPTHQWQTQPSTTPVVIDLSQDENSTTPNTDHPLLLPEATQEEVDEDVFAKKTQKIYKTLGLNQGSFNSQIIDLSQDPCTEDHRAKKTKTTSSTYREAATGKIAHHLPVPKGQAATDENEEDEALNIIGELFEIFPLAWKPIAFIRSILNCEQIIFNKSAGTITPNVFNMSKSQAKSAVDMLKKHQFFLPSEKRQVFITNEKFTKFAEASHSYYSKLAPLQDGININEIWKVTNNFQLEDMIDEAVQDQLKFAFSQNISLKEKIPTIINSLVSKSQVIFDHAKGTIIPNVCHLAVQDVRFIAQLLIQYNYLNKASVENIYTPTKKFEKFYASLITPDVTTVSYETVPSKTTI